MTTLAMLAELNRARMPAATARETTNTARVVNLGSWPWVSVLGVLVPLVGATV